MAYTPEWETSDSRIDIPNYVSDQGSPPQKTLG